MTDKDEKNRLSKIEALMDEILSYAEEHDYINDGTVAHACAAILSKASENKETPMTEFVSCYVSYFDGFPRLIIVQDDLSGLKQAVDNAGYEDLKMCGQYYISKNNPDIEGEMEELDALLDSVTDTKDTLH